MVVTLLLTALAEPTAPSRPPEVEAPAAPDDHAEEHADPTEAESSLEPEAAEPDAPAAAEPVPAVDAHPTSEHADEAPHPAPAPPHLPTATNHPAPAPAPAPAPSSADVPVFAPQSLLDEHGHPIAPPELAAEPDGGKPVDAPAATPPVVPTIVSQPVNTPVVLTSPFERLIPERGARGIRPALGFTLIALLCGIAAGALQRLGSRFRPSGIVPSSLRIVELVLRTLVAVFGLGIIASLMPAFLAPAIPVVVLAGAVAVGWSARDVVTDLVAGLFMGVEGQLRAGYWIQGERYAGTVETIGLRVTWLRDVHGRRIVVPNRVLLAQPLVADDSPWPRIQFTVALPLDEPADVRAALDEAIVLSPWVAPEPDVEVHPDATQPGHWQVAVRLLDGQYADRFQGNLRERVVEILAASHTD